MCHQNEQFDGQTVRPSHTVRPIGERYDHIIVQMLRTYHQKQCGPWCSRDIFNTGVKEQRYFTCEGLTYFTLMSNAWGNIVISECYFFT